MPIPFLLGAIGAVSAVVGIGGHLSAKGTNERAQQIADEAQQIYNEGKRNLEETKRSTENSLMRLGYKKKEVLETSMKQFMIAYERVKGIQSEFKSDVDEISKFAIDENGILEIQQMNDIYENTASSAAAGAATGAVIALAASGALPVVASTLGTAGSALIAGEFGAAASIAGSAFSFGAAMTPLAAIAAPVIAFTGISSSIKADENLSKATQMHAQAEVAVEEMKTSCVKCAAIGKRADMYDDLLDNVNYYFSTCAGMMDRITRKKQGFFRKKKIRSGDIDANERAVLSAAFSLAGTVQAILATPILGPDGEITQESENIDDISGEIDIMKEQTQQCVALNPGVKALPAPKYKGESSESRRNTEKRSMVKVTHTPEAIRDVFALFIGSFAGAAAMNYFGWIAGTAALTIVTLMIMNNDSYFGFFRFIRTFFGVIFSLIPCIYFATGGNAIGLTWWIVLGGIASVFGSVILTVLSNGRSFPLNLGRAFGAYAIFAIATLLFVILNGFIHVGITASTVIVEIIYVPCAVIFTGVLPQLVHE